MPQNSANKILSQFVRCFLLEKSTDRIEVNYSRSEQIQIYTTNESKLQQ